MAWYIAIDGVQQGPLEAHDLPARGLQPDTLVWAEGMADWQRADTLPELRHLFQHGSPPPLPPADGGSVPYYATPAASTNRVAAGVLGILLGSLGVHKFVLGYTGVGLIMLLSTILSCGVLGMLNSIIGIVEGVIYLTKTDEQFYQEYVLHQRPWF